MRAQALQAPARPVAPAAPQYLTVPADFPAITVTVPANGTADGYVFAANFGWGPVMPTFLMILDNQGEPVYYQRLPSYAHDFTMQPDGTLSYFDGNRQAFVIMDNTYRELAVFYPGSGYSADPHDLQLLPNGHYLWLVGETRTVDMSKVVSGGKPQAQVVGQVIQELDHNGQVVWEWHAFDHLPITDSTEDLTAQVIDYTHCNSIVLDNDGNLLLSIRHLDEVAKINRQTGDIIWRLGGKENQFNFSAVPGITDPPQFNHQHDVIRLPNGHLTVFDNHNNNIPERSRALEFILDETARTATLIWQYSATPDLYAVAMGNVQRLSNGNTMIGWGSNFFPTLTEVKPDGSKAFELDFADPNVTYRAFRFPFHGAPAWPPTLLMQPSGSTLNLTFSWNGATDVGSYQVYGGNTSPATTLLATQPRAGFETSVAMQGAQASYCFYRIVPLDTQGQPMAYSTTGLNTTLGDPACFSRSYLPMASR